MSMPMFVPIKNAQLLTCGSSFKAMAAVFVLSFFCAATLPVTAKDAAKAEATTPHQAQTKAANNAPAAVAGKTAKKKNASLADPPVGATTTAELVKKLSDAYMNKDDVAYLSLLKAPMRTRIRMHQQFRREFNKPVANFKFVKIAEEAARIKASLKTVGTRTIVNGVVEDYDLPVIGFIDYERRDNVQAPADKRGIAVGKGKGAFFLVTLQPVEGAAAATVIPTASGTVAPTKTTAPSSAPIKPPLPVKAH
jgi:hypothetical protein